MSNFFLSQSLFWTERWPYSVVHVGCTGCVSDLYDMIAWRRYIQNIFIRWQMNLEEVEQPRLHAVLVSECPSIHCIGIISKDVVVGALAGESSLRPIRKLVFMR